MSAKRIATALPVLALLVATALVIVLGRQLNDTRKERDLISKRLRSLQPGAYAPIQQVPTLDGATVALGEVKPGTRQVVFVYNTECPFCLASIPTWQRVADRLRNNPAANVVAVSLDSVAPTRAYAARHGLRYPSAILVDQRATNLFRFSSVPQTLVIDENGRVLYSRLGRLDDGPAVDSVLTAVSRPLPGTRTATRAVPAAQTRS